MEKHIDKSLLTTTLMLVITGMVFFLSASLGVLTVNEIKFYSVLKSQGSALVIGMVLMTLFAYIPYTYLYKKSYYIYASTLFLTALTFIPQISLTHNGASRWLDLGPFMLQPSEFLKISFVLMVAYICLNFRDSMDVWYKSIGMFLLASFPAIVIVVLQPDMTTLGVILLGGFVAWFVSGVKMSHVGVVIGAFLLIFGFAATFYPHVQDRIKTYFSPNDDTLGKAFQIRQSVIAFGAGGVFGSGLFQSMQKYTYLPEPIGDSIIAVIGEEVGFIGISLLVILFLFFAYHGYKISAHSEGFAGRMISASLTSIILFQALVNIGANSKAIFLVGVPLPFISHGGTAIVVNLIMVGILLNISKTSTK